MITGLEQPDAGRVRFFGEAAPAFADRHGWQERVACVYQRPSVFANLTVAENLFAGRLPIDQGKVSWRRMRSDAERILDEWGIRADPRSLLADAPIEQRQMIQIAKALEAGTRIILLDEPTVQLEAAAVRRLFDKVQELKHLGVTFIFVSHFLGEVSAICDSATVLRDGRVLWSRRGEEISDDDLVGALLAGQEKHRHKVAAAAHEREGQALRLDAIGDAAGAFSEVSLGLAPGELVAVGGLGGSGKYALGEAIAGLRRLSGGQISVGDQIVPPGRVKAAQRAGIGYVPADRHRDGYVPQLSIAENMTIAVMDQMSRGGFFSPRRQTEASRALIRDVALVPPDPKLPVAALSGGNQQKVVLGRALARQPRVLVLVSPTAGVDIAAKDAIYSLMMSALDRGVAIVLISDDVEELLVSERVVVMRDGRISAELTNPDEEDLVRAIEGME